MGAGATKTAEPARPVTAPGNAKTAMNGHAANDDRRQIPKSADTASGNQNETPDSAARTSRAGDPPNYHRSQIPPPRPPRTSKSDIFSVEKYKEVDDFVLNAPPKLLVGNFNELIKYLTRSHDRWDDLCKVRAIFLWVTSIDVYNLKVDGVPPTHSPLEYFTKIQCNMGNHAHLVSGLCQMAGIPCVIISGMNKSAAYEIGGRCDRKSMGAQWNAVYINDDWRFLDAFWASACVVGRKSGEWTLVDSDGNVTQEDDDISEGTTQHRINEFYFMPDPDKLIWTHFPDELQWQLLDKPIVLKEFEDHVYIRERFHYLGMKLMPNSQDKALLFSKDGEIELVFSLPVKQSESSRFKYMLYKGQKGSANPDEEDLLLDRFVMFEHTANLLRFSLRFPIKGKFKMDVFGLDVNESDIFDLACTYIITCNEPMKNCLPLPDVPPIGWGPGANAKEAGLKPITHDGAIIVTKDGNVEIRLSADKNIQLHQMLKHALIDEATLSNYAVTRLENGEAVVNIRLPQGGEYALKLYADDPGKEGVAPNVLNYLIKSDGKNVHNAPFPNINDGSVGKKPASDLLGVKAITHKGSNISAKNGRARVEFQAKTGMKMMAELHSSDELACKRMLVTPREENGKWVFDLDMPESGEYSLNVFACNQNSTDRIFNVHSYLVKSEGRKLEQGEVNDRQENKQVQTHVPIETVQTSDNEVLIPIPPGFEDVCATLYRRNANDPPDAQQLDIIEQDGIQLVRARLPEYGEYQMHLYDRDDAGVVRNIAKYQINRRPPGELYDDNTKMLMQNLGATAPIIEEEQLDVAHVDRNETDEDKKSRVEDAHQGEICGAVRSRKPQRSHSAISFFPRHPLSTKDGDTTEWTPPAPNRIAHSAKRIRILKRYSYNTSKIQEQLEGKSVSESIDNDTSITSKAETKSKSQTPILKRTSHSAERIRILNLSTILSQQNTMAHITPKPPSIQRKCPSALSFLSKTSSPITGEDNSDSTAPLRNRIAHSAKRIRIVNPDFTSPKSSNQEYFENDISSKMVKEESKIDSSILEDDRTAHSIECSIATLTHVAPKQPSIVRRSTSAMSFFPKQSSFTTGVDKCDSPTPLARNRIAHSATRLRKHEFKPDITNISTEVNDSPSVIVKGESKVNASTPADELIAPSAECTTATVVHSAPTPPSIQGRYPSAMSFFPSKSSETTGEDECETKTPVRNRIAHSAKRIRILNRNHCVTTSNSSNQEQLGRENIAEEINDSSKLMPKEESQSDQIIPVNDRTAHSIECSIAKLTDVAPKQPSVIRRSSSAMSFFPKQSSFTTGVDKCDSPTPLARNRIAHSATRLRKHEFKPDIANISLEVNDDSSIMVKEESKIKSPNPAGELKENSAECTTATVVHTAPTPPSIQGRYPSAMSFFPRKSSENTGKDECETKTPVRNRIAHSAKRIRILNLNHCVTTSNISNQEQLGRENIAEENNDSSKLMPKEESQSDLIIPVNDRTAHSIECSIAKLTDVAPKQPSVIRRSSSAMSFFPKQSSFTTGVDKCDSPTPLARNRIAHSATRLRKHKFKPDIANISLEVNDDSSIMVKGESKIKSPNPAGELKEISAECTTATVVHTAPTPPSIQGRSPSAMSFFPRTSSAATGENECDTPTPVRNRIAHSAKRIRIRNRNYFDTTSNSSNQEQPGRKNITEEINDSSKLMPKEESTSVPIISVNDRTAHSIECSIATLTHVAPKQPTIIRSPSAMSFFPKQSSFTTGGEKYDSSPIQPVRNRIAHSAKRFRILKLVPDISKQSESNNISLEINDSTSTIVKEGSQCDISTSLDAIKDQSVEQIITTVAHVAPYQTITRKSSLAMIALARRTEPTKEDCITESTMPIPNRLAHSAKRFRIAASTADHASKISSIDQRCPTSKRSLPRDSPITDDSRIESRTSTREKDFLKQVDSSTMFTGLASKSLEQSEASINATESRNSHLVIERAHQRSAEPTVGSRSEYKESFSNEHLNDTTTIHGNGFSTKQLLPIPPPESRRKPTVGRSRSHNSCFTNQSSYFQAGETVKKENSRSLSVLGNLELHGSADRFKSSLRGLVSENVDTTHKPDKQVETTRSVLKYQPTEEAMIIFSNPRDSVSIDEQTAVKCLHHNELRRNTLETAMISIDKRDEDKNFNECSNKQSTVIPNQQAASSDVERINLEFAQQNKLKPESKNTYSNLETVKIEDGDKHLHISSKEQSAMVPNAQGPNNDIEPSPVESAQQNKLKSDNGDIYENLSTANIYLDHFKAENKEVQTGSRTVSIMAPSPLNPASQVEPAAIEFTPHNALNSANKLKLISDNQVGVVKMERSSCKLSSHETVKFQLTDVCKNEFDSESKTTFEIKDLHKPSKAWTIMVQNQQTPVNEVDQTDIEFAQHSELISENRNVKPPSNKVNLKTTPFSSSSNSQPSRETESPHEDLIVPERAQDKEATRQKATSKLFCDAFNKLESTLQSINHITTNDNKTENSTLTTSFEPRRDCENSTLDTEVIPPLKDLRILSQEADRKKTDGQKSDENQTAHTTDTDHAMDESSNYVFSDEPVEEELTKSTASSTKRAPLRNNQRYLDRLNQERASCSFKELTSFDQIFQEQETTVDYPESQNYRNVSANANRQNSMLLDVKLPVPTDSNASFKAIERKSSQLYFKNSEYLFDDNEESVVRCPEEYNEALQDNNEKDKIKPEINENTEFPRQHVTASTRPVNTSTFVLSRSEIIRNDTTVSDRGLQFDDRKSEHMPPMDRCVSMTQHSRQYIETTQDNTVKDSTKQELPEFTEIPREHVTTSTRPVNVSTCVPSRAETKRSDAMVTPEVLFIEDETAKNKPAERNFKDPSPLTFDDCRDSPESYLSTSQLSGSIFRPSSDLDIPMPSNRASISPISSLYSSSIFATDDDVHMTFPDLKDSACSPILFEPYEKPDISGAYSSRTPRRKQNDVATTERNDPVYQTQQNLNQQPSPRNSQTKRPHGFESPTVSLRLTPESAPKSCATDLKTNPCPAKKSPLEFYPRGKAFLSFAQPLVPIASLVLSTTVPSVPGFTSPGMHSVHNIKPTMEQLTSLFCTYQFNGDCRKTSKKPFTTPWTSDEQRRAMRRQIQKAIDMKDPEMLERYIIAYENLNPPYDDDVLLKARKMLAALDAKEELTQACQRRDLESLKRAIARAQEVNYEHQLDLQLALANRLKDQLGRIERLRHAVLSLTTPTIAEIKSYGNPPDGVHQSMMATFILLGNSPKEVRVWKTCQNLMGKTGREGLMRRISTFDPRDCDSSTAAMAKKLIDPYGSSQIRDVSAGAAAFFGWSKGMIDEIEATRGKAPERKEVAQPQRKTKSGRKR